MENKREPREQAKKEQPKHPTQPRQEHPTPPRQEHPTPPRQEHPTQPRQEQPMQGQLRQLGAWHPRTLTGRLLITTHLDLQQSTPSVRAKMAQLSMDGRLMPWAALLTQSWPTEMQPSTMGTVGIRALSPCTIMEKMSQLPVVQSSLRYSI